MGVPLSPRVSSIEEGWRHPWSPHHRRGAPVKKSQNQGWMIIYPNPGMIHTCHPMIILQHLSTIQGSDDPYLPSKNRITPKYTRAFFRITFKRIFNIRPIYSVEEISYTSCNSM